MAQLIPIYSKPVVPGDRYRMGVVYQMQLAPMYNPVYDGLTVNFEAFFVPNRILDKKWREFWTGYNEYDQMTQTDIAPLTFKVNINSDLSTVQEEKDSVGGNCIGISSLLDYLGYRFSHYDPVNHFPSDRVLTGNGRTSFELNAIPILGYHRIYDDWYRNERTQRATLYDYYNTDNPATRILETSLTTSLDGKLLVTSNDYLYFHVRNYGKDRFTTALPEPIIGGDVRIPVGESFNHLGSGTDSLLTGAAVNTVTGQNGSSFGVVRDIKASSADGISLNALALGTIQQLKLAFKEYEFRMKDTYNGNRYVESIDAHYGIRVPDSTLQRSLYLGSAQDYVNFGEVYQTSAGNGQDLESGSLGDYAGRGSSNGTHYLFDETFYEPGYIFIIFSISPKARYFQGVHRHLVRFERDDYFSPEFQNIGDDFIENREIYHEFLHASETVGDTSDNTKIFGYQTRWYDLKSNYDELHGDFAQSFRSGSRLPNLGPMMSWNFTRAFGDVPTISSEFSQIPVINRPFISTDERNDNYFVDVYFDIQALRPVLTTESF